MEGLVSISILSEALGISKTAVSKRFAALPHVFAVTRGGKQKSYAVRHLPQDVRLQLVAKEAEMISDIQWESTKAAISLKENKALQAEKQAITAENLLALFNGQPEEKKAIAYARRDLLKMRDEWLKAAGAPVKSGTIKFAAMYNEGLLPIPAAIQQTIVKISWPTLNRWHKAYQEKGIIALVPRYRNPQKETTKLTEDQMEFVLALLCTKPHIRYKGMMKALAARYREIPGEGVVRRFVKSWKEKNASLYLYLTNPDKWRNQHQFALGSASENIVRLNQLWEFDSTPADLLLTDGRYCLIGVIDVYSRRLKLHVSKTSRASAVAALLRKSLLDWGVPEIAKTDNGSDYVSHHIVSVIDALQIEQQLCPPFTPECKPHIERVFKTFAHSYQEMMPGYIGHSVADRKDIEARNSFASRIMGKGETVAINMTAEELQTYCDRWVNALYHQEPHRGLNNRTPQQMVVGWKQSVQKIKNERALDILLAEAPDNHGIRVVGKDGIKVGSLTYIADNLPEAKTKVKVKLDPLDLGIIYLFDAETNEFLTVAKEPLRTGVDRAETGAKIKARQKKLVQEGAKELRKIARKQAVENIHDEILQHAESKQANIVPLPPREEEYTTPALEQAELAAKAMDQSNREDDLLDGIGLFDKITEPIGTPTTKPAKKEKIVLLRSDADQYALIREKIKTGDRLLSKEDITFLNRYYKTASGSMYLALEGDLREEYSPDEDQAEA